MPPTSAPTAAPSLQEQLVRETSSMVRHLMTNGIRVPSSVVQAADQFETALHQNRPIDITALAGTHDRLARLVSPAKPGTLYMLDASYEQAGAEGSTLGPVRLVRDMVRVAIVCVAIFIVLSVMSIVEAHPTVELFGRDMVIVEIILERVFWLAAAGIGASFAMLFQLNDQIVSRTFDPDENASYWVKFFLGLVAGFILVALVPINGPAQPGGATTTAQALGPPTAALLGGFSASAVYRILTRMVEALESIFTGGVKEQAAAAEKAASSRANDENVQGRMAVAGQLVDLQQRLAAGLSPEEASARLRQVVAGLVPAGPEIPRYDSAAPAAPPADAVPVPAIFAAPQDAGASVDTAAPADAAGTGAQQPEESAAAAG